MFSLVITIIAVVLIVLVSYATLSYGGGAFTQGSAKARAAALDSQAEQILAATTLYQANNGRWPTTLAELADGQFLTTIPTASVLPESAVHQVLDSLSDLVIPTAQAAPAIISPWLTVSSATPQYVLNKKASLKVCQEVNRLRQGVEGVKQAADPTLSVQCFGVSEPYTLLAQVPGAGATALTTSTLQAATGDTSLTVQDTGGAWAVAPQFLEIGVPPPPTGPEIRNSATGLVITSFAFPNVTVGQSSSATLQITNTGADPIQLASAPVTATAPFAVTSTTCSGVLAAAPAGNSSCSATLSFTPTAAQGYSGDFYVNSTGGVVSDISFAGTGVGNVSSPAPTIDTLSPATGTIAGGTSVTVNGSNFKSDSQVSFNGSVVPMTYVSPTQLQFVTPAGTAGNAALVTVTNPSSGGTASSPANFTYLSSEGVVSTFRAYFYVDTQMGNLAINSAGAYGFGFNYFRFDKFDGTSATLIKSSGWSMCLNNDSNMQPYQWALMPNGNVAAIVNCSSPVGYSYVAEITPAGALVRTPYQITTGNFLTALTVDGSNNIYFNTGGADSTRIIRRMAPNGAVTNLTSLSGPETIGMAVDPTNHYIYYAGYGNGIPTLYRCDTTATQSSCATVGNMDGSMSFPSNGDRTIRGRPHLIFSASGQLFAASQTVIYKVDKANAASTPYLGSNFTSGEADGVGATAKLVVGSMGRAPDGTLYYMSNGTLVLHKWQ